MSRKSRKAPEGAVIRASNGANDVQIGLRMPKELLAQIDAHRKKLKGLHPGVGISRADAIRSLIQTGLEVG